VNDDLLASLKRTQEANTHQQHMLETQISALTTELEAGQAAKAEADEEFRQQLDDVRQALHAKTQALSVAQESSTRAARRGDELQAVMAELQGQLESAIQTETKLQAQQAEHLTQRQEVDKVG